MSRRFSGHHLRFFFILRISSRKSKEPTKTSKKDHSFYNAVLLKKPHSFLTHLTLKIICSRNTAKNLSDKVSSKLVSVWCQKKYLHYTIFWHPRTAFLKHFESKCLYISICLLKKICFRDVIRFVLVGGGDWINFLRRFAVWALQNVLQFFILIEIFENSTIFSISIHLFIALKRSNFPGNLDFKGRIAAIFLIRSHFISV